MIDSFCILFHATKTRSTRAASVRAIYPTPLRHATCPTTHPHLHTAGTPNLIHHYSKPIKRINPYSKMAPSNSAGNPLSARSLSTFMATSLPKGDGPQLKNAYEAVALLIHAGMIAVGFRLVGLGEEHRIGWFLTSHSFESVLTSYQKRQQMRRTPTLYRQNGTHHHHTHFAMRTHSRPWNTWSK
jgi:hypothetical protein